MIKIQVMEKNGTPRDLNFDKNVVTIGRSARNDIILPRSNISKNHVSIEVSKERCVVSDMGSTNGTFVNGRRIEKPVVVEPEDKIYVSDFILKVSYEDEIPEELSGIHEIIEPDDSSDLDAKTVAGITDDLIETLPPGKSEEQPEAPPSAPPPTSIHDFETRRFSSKESAKPAGRAKKKSPRPKTSPGKAPQRPPEEKIRELCSGLYAKIAEYMQLDKTDIHSMGSEEFEKKAGRVIAEILDSAADSEGLYAGLEPRELSEKLQAEILGLGPLDAYLYDPLVREISVMPSGAVVLVTDEGPKKLPDPFISQESRMFILRRLVYMAGAALQEGDSIITGSLENGSSVKIVSPPLAVDGTTFSIQKPLPLKGFTLKDLEENDIISTKIAKLLEYCLQMRRGILVADPLGLSHKTLMPALASALPPWERIAVVQCGTEPVYNVNTELYFRISSENPEVFTLSKSGENLYTIIPSLQPTVIFVGEMSSSQLLKLARLCALSKSAIIASVREPGPLDVVARLKQMVFSEYPELDGENLSKTAVEGFDLLLCYAKMSDRSEKVTLVSDITFSKEGKINLKPIFHYEVKEIDSLGNIHGSFRATRAVPSFIEEKRQRGAQLDVSMFQ